MNENNNQSLSLFEYTFFSQFFFFLPFILLNSVMLFFLLFLIGTSRNPIKIIYEYSFLCTRNIFLFFMDFFPFSAPEPIRFDHPSHHLNTIPILNTAVVFVWRVNRVCWILERSWLDWREADEQFFLAYQTKTPARMYTLILSFQPSPSYCYTSLESWDVWKWNGNFDIFLLQMKNCWRLEICAILYSTQRNIQGNWNEFKSAP